ncbi:S8 family serine peptidase [Epilithonimonas sp. UC225_85]|uniref:S8 family serine peptidase n=1 Tax=Epilithonimonas sp. UC225_85 TaxID=3350167 RepID=UPI0036D41AAF
MKTKIFIFGLLWLCIFIPSQSIKYTYYIEFANPSNKPVITRQNQSTKIISFNSHRLEVLQYKEAFSEYTTESLKNTSLIEFKTVTDFNDFISSNENDIVTYNKIEILDQPFLEIKTMETPKIYSVENYKNILYTPNDYYLWPYDLAHTHWDLINAREAWDYSKGDSITVGIADSGFRLTHKEFENKISTIPGQTVTNTDPGHHGNVIAGLAGAKTDNNFGGSSIGFNNRLLVTTDSSWDSLKKLSANGARIINMSWAESCSSIPQSQTAINEIYNNGTVLVAAAGNGSYPCGSPSYKVYPAAYDNVISVSGVGHLNEINSGITTNVKDVHYYNYATQEESFSHYDAVDIVAPACNIIPMPRSDCDECFTQAFVGTSIAAPIVSGALSLLFASNNCLSPLEAETILKLTSADIDQIPLNQAFAGLLGAGRLDAGKANKMAWQMNPANGGEVLIENKNFNRWNFELVNSPEHIKIQNESFTGSSNINFKAKKGIKLETNTLLEPGTGKSHSFYISNTDTCSSFNETGFPLTNQLKKKNTLLDSTSISVYPNPFTDVLKISDVKGVKSVSVNDISGRQVKTLAPSAELNLSNLKTGLYIVNLQMEDGSVKSFKAIKK